MNGLHQAVRVEGDLVDGGFTVVAEAGGEHAERRVVAMVGHEQRSLPSASVTCTSDWCAVPCRFLEESFCSSTPL
mgnify:CR=1 FL=1